MKSKLQLFKEGVMNPTPSTLTLARMMTFGGMGLGGIAAVISLFILHSWIYMTILFFFTVFQFVAFIQERQQYKNIRKMEMELKEQEVKQNGRME